MTAATQTPVDSFLYPWQQQQFADFTQHAVPHALLLYGQKDIGKLHFGLELTRYLLCESATHKSCHHCAACHWIGQGNHPDVFILIPQALKAQLPFEMEDELQAPEGEEKKLSKFIRIEHIRQMISKNTLGSYRGGKRVVLIYPVESMQIEAANCLLKTLEEPSENLHFILITSQLERILPTIRSRCQLTHIPKPATTQAIAWLKEHVPNIPAPGVLEQKLLLQGGSPLQVLASSAHHTLDESLVIQQLALCKAINAQKIIDLLSDHPLLEILNCLLKWSIDMNLVLFQIPPRYFPSHEKQLQNICTKLQPVPHQQFLTSLKEDLRMANHPLFPKVQLDAVLMRYKQLF